MAFARLRPEIVLLPLALAAALSACTRAGPPAPVVMGDAADGEAPQPPAQARAPAIATIAPPALALPAPKPVPASPLVAPPPAPSPPVPSAAATPPVAAPQSHRAHPDQVVVAPGETLYMISRRYDVPLRAIIDANHLEPPYRMAAGTRLGLPQTAFHVVQPGETLYAISRLYGVEVSTLARINHLDEPFAIRAGEALDLPPSVAPRERSLGPPPPPVLAPSAPAAAAPAVAALPPAKPASARPLPNAPAKPGPRGPAFAWPLEGRILEAYGTGPAGTHNDGINIAARAGEPVRAAESGIVAYAGNELRGYGNLVLIKHRGGYMTAYAHNGRLLVKRGQAVKRGQVIATAGATGSVGAPQLHFEIRHGTRALDPIGYLPALNASAN